MPPGKREPETAASPSKLQRLDVADLEVPGLTPLTAASHSGTPQSRRSSIDLSRTSSAAARSESNPNFSRMSDSVKETLFGTKFAVPPGLIDEIIKGNCIAFVGSGFTAPLIGDWNKLLKDLLADARDEVNDCNSKHPENAADREDQFRFLLEKADKLRGMGSSAEYDYFAQEIEDLVGEKRFQHLIQGRCRLDDNTVITNLMKTRLEALSRIPFKAIITTNYNNCFLGKVATLNGETDETHFEDILRPERDFQQGAQDSASKAELLNTVTPSPSPSPSRCIDQQASRAFTPKPSSTDDGIASLLSDTISSCPAFQHLVKPDDPSGMTLFQARDKYRISCPVLKIHGCVHHPDSIVLSRNAYKRLKHETPGYKMFLTTAMATSTMLYIGFSFTDDYLNDFRAEVLSMLRPRRSLQFGKEPSANAFRSSSTVPIGYGIIEGKTKYDCKFFRRHEGVEIMTWTPNYVPSPADAPLGLTSLGDVSTEAPQNTTKWHNGLDVYLQHIFQKTHSNYINGQMLTQNFFSSRRKIITWDLGDEKRTANHYLRQCLKYYNNMTKSQEHSGFREEAMKRLRLHELATGQSLLQSDTSNSPIVRPLSIPIGPLQSKDCIIAVRSADQLAQQLAEHAGKVSCVITAFGTCQSLQAELGDALYDPNSKDKFYNANHIVRQVCDVMSAADPMHRCPFIVYAHQNMNQNARMWRQELSLKLGAFGFANDTKDLMKEMDSATNYLKLLKSSTI